VALVLLACIAGAGYIAAPLVHDRVDDWLTEARGALTDRTPVAFGDTVTLTDSIYHPSMELRADRVTRAGSNRELVAVRLRMRNTGEEAWQSGLWKKLTLVDRVGYSHDVVSARIPGRRALPERITVRPGATQVGYVVFRVPAGRDVKELQFKVSPVEDDLLVWRTARALS
jgi:hypothetical protein